MGKIKRRPGRPKSRSPKWDAMARRAVRQHNNLDWALLCFGPHICAEEVIRRYKAECKAISAKYSREFAIDEAAKLVGMDAERLKNWLNRSKQPRRKK